MTADDARVVLLKGPPGAGKTSVGRMLAARAAGGACVHGDDLAGFVVRRSASVALGLGYANAAAVAAAFVRGGYELVVVDYVFEARRHVDRLMAAFDAAAAVFLFTLCAPLDVVEARERTRGRRRPLGARVAACHAAITAALPELGCVVDARLEPAALAAEIDRRSRAGDGLLRAMPATAARRRP